MEEDLIVQLEQRCRSLVRQAQQHAEGYEIIGIGRAAGEIGQGSAGGLGALSGHAKGYMIAI